MKIKYIAVLIIAAAIMAGIGFRYSATGAKKEAHSPEKASKENHKEDKERHDDEKIVKLHADDIKEFGIEIKEAGQGRMAVQIELPGEITPNADRLVSIVPRVSGVVRTVSKNLGDQVRAGDVLAVLDSKEMSDSKAAYLTALKRMEIAQTNLKREETLYKKKISPELDYLDAGKAFAEAQIELRSSEQKLYALGFTAQDLSALPTQSNMSFTRYEMKAPFSGTLIEKHISLGAALKDDTAAFVIADMSSVWVNISVYQKDMLHVKKGQHVIISAGSGIPDAKGSISYISPVTGQETRTAIARVVLPNAKDLLRPGLFVTAKLAVAEVSVPVLIPKTAITSEGGKSEVFVQTEEGFKPQVVTLGRSSDTHVEVISGLANGQKYVAKGGFTLKAQMSKGAFGDGHSNH
ncbi:MAG: efflux RND transporter periplasmic adaptor subunit [Nitrospirae bacterium]|nr:MAG: efflux RND transporter periplasmic adaptor subunit [Nitrospirota bacterium]